jgi:hypothetical protein
MQHVVSGADAVSGANVASPPPPPPKPADKPAPAVEAFQELIDGPLTRYVDLSKEIGGLVAEQVRGQPSRRHALQYTSVLTRQRSRTGAASREWLPRSKGLYPPRIGVHPAADLGARVPGLDRPHPDRFARRHRRQGEEPRREREQPAHRRQRRDPRPRMGHPRACVCIFPRATNSDAACSLPFPFARFCRTASRVHTSASSRTAVCSGSTGSSRNTKTREEFVRVTLYSSGTRSTAFHLRARRNLKQVEWARSFIAVLEELRKYIMQYHTTGLTWNPEVRSLAVSLRRPSVH